MTTTEQVKSCIEKAVQGGWHKDKIKGRKYKIHQHNDGEYTIFIDDRTASPICLGVFNDIIFNKSFLKAFFGEGMVCKGCGKEPDSQDVYHESFYKCYECGSLKFTAIWKFEGNQLLLSDDRRAYMKEFLEVKK